MGLLTLLKRFRSDRAASPASAAAAASVRGDESVERIRTRARHRLIGAVVLLGAAVIGFPLLFETQPRPIPVDLPIHIPKQDAVPPLALPGGGAGAHPAAGTLDESLEEAGLGVVPTEPVAVPAPAPQQEARVQSGVKPVPGTMPAPEVKLPAKPEPKPGPKTEAKLAAKAEAPAEPKSLPKTEPKKPEPQKPLREETRPVASEASRAQALLEGRTPPPVRAEPVRVSDAGRFVLQVGAYSEGSSAREARQKVERAGLQSYTQEVQTSEGRRIRVRVGPFPSREAADQAAARLRAAGLPVAVLPQ